MKENGFMYVDGLTENSLGFADLLELQNNWTYLLLMRMPIASKYW